MNSQSINSSININKVYFYCILLFITALLISPYILPLRIENPYLNGPKLWLYLVTGVALLLTAFKLCLHNSQYGIILKLSGPDYIIVLIVLHIIFSQYFIHQSFNLTDKILIYTCLSILYFVIRFYVSSLDSESLQHFLNILIGIILTITLISCYHGLSQYLELRPSNNTYFKVTGAFYNPARFSNYLIALLPFCISAFFFFPNESKWHKIIKCAAAVVCLTGLFLLSVTYIRSAWLGIIGAIITILSQRYKAYFVFLLRNVWLLSLSIITVVGFLFLLYMLKPVSA